MPCGMATACKECYKQRLRCRSLQRLFVLSRSVIQEGARSALVPRAAP